MPKKTTRLINIIIVVILIAALSPAFPYGMRALAAPPVAADDPGLSTPEDTPATFDVTANDTDPDGNLDPTSANTSCGTCSSTSHGSLTNNGDGTFNYTPASNYNGSDGFTYEVCDLVLECSTATATITVTAVNDAPVATPQSVSTNEDIALPVILSGTDVDGNPLTYSINTNPSNGVLTGSGASRTYTPNTNFNGSDSFTFVANDGTVNSAPATISITVNAVNDAPVATPQSVSTNEDTALPITLSGTDVDGNPLTYSINTNPSNGVLTGTGTSRTYTPNTNFNGNDSFTFVANDGTVNSAPGTVSITVNAVNDAPVATPQSVSTNEDIALPITLSGTDVDGNPLTYSINTNPSNGVLTGSGASRTYTPNTNYNGSDSFTFVANDGTVNSAPATISITVNAVNDAPVATPQSVSTNEDTALPITLSGTDVDGNPLTYSIGTGPTNGVLTGTGTSRTYTPNLNFNGSDSFTFVANDGTVNSVPATVSITVNPVDDRPVAVDDDFNAAPNTTLNIAAPGVLANDTDIDDLADTLRALLISPTSHGIVTLFADGGFSYVPNTGFSGVDSFTYRARNTLTSLNTATVTITVEPAPNAIDDSYSTPEETQLVVTALEGVLSNDSHPTGATLTAELLTPPPSGTLSLSANGSFTYTPANNFTGPVMFTYEAVDTSGYRDSATVTITVTGANDPPVANNQSVVTDEDTPKSITLTATDPDGDQLAYTVLTNPSHGSLSGTAPYLTYTPNLNYHGSDSFTFRVSDGIINSNTATVSITVTSINDPPVANDDAFVLNTITANQNGRLVIPIADLLSNDSDPDQEDTLTVRITDYGQPTHGDVWISSNGENIIYAPNANFELGEDSFVYRLSDGKLGNNALVTITVDLVSPAYDWLQPTDTVYIQDDAATVTFQVDASDNAGVQRVVLKNYDPIKRAWVVIASKTASPYTFNVKAIKLFRHWNQIRAWVYDVNGNLTITDVIFVWQRGRTALPVIHR